MQLDHDLMANIWELPFLFGIWILVVVIILQLYQVYKPFPDSNFIVDTNSNKTKFYSRGGKMQERLSKKAKNNPENMTLLEWQLLLDKETFHFTREKGTVVWPNFWRTVSHSVAHSTKPSSRPKTNNQSIKKILSLAVSWVKVVKNWASF